MISDPTHHSPLTTHPTAFMLLEVVIAVGVLVLGMAFVGAQIHNSSRLERESERALRGLLLAESKMAELDTGIIQPEEEIEKEFGPLFPDYGWRLKIDTTTVPELNLVTLQILHQVRLDAKAEFDFDEAKVVHALYTMRATPTRLDLTRDFGLDDKKADDLTEKLSSVGEAGLDPRDLDPALFKNLDLEQLLEVAPVLLEAFGMSITDVKKLLPPELQQALDEAQAEFEAEREGETAEGGEKAGGEQAGGTPTKDQTPAPGSDTGGTKDGGQSVPAPPDLSKPPRQRPPGKGDRPKPIKGNRGGNKGPVEPS